MKLDLSDCDIYISALPAIDFCITILLQVDLLNDLWGCRTLIGKNRTFSLLTSFNAIFIFLVVLVGCVSKWLG